MRQILRAMMATLLGLTCWYASGSALAQPPCNASPTAAQKSEAGQAMGAGVAFLNDPEGKHYDDAYPQFKRAYELSCSLNALRNLALCEMNLELDGDALVHYEEVLAKKTDLAEGDRAQIQSDVNRLKATVAWVTLSADRDNAQLIDTRTPNRGGAIRNTYTIGTKTKRLGVHPGVHKFVASVDGLNVEWDIEIKAGSEQTYAFSFANAEAGIPQPPTPDPIVGDDQEGGFSLPIYVWIAGGVTIASAVVMGVMMGVSSAKKSDFDDNLQGKAPLSEQQAAVSDIQTFSLVADIFIGVTVAGAATTLILALTAPDDSEEEAHNKKGPQFGVDYTVTPLVGDHGGGAALTVQF